MLVVVGLAVAMVFGVVVGRTYCVGKKRFGLKEAEAAMQYIGRDSGAARPVMGVVLGVLQYENAVAKDVAELATKLNDDNDEATEKIDANRRQISELEAANADLLTDIARNHDRSSKVLELASLFQA